MQRFYLPETSFSSAPIEVKDKDLLHQIKDVLRANPGDVFYLFNNDKEIQAEILDIRKDAIWFNVNDSDVKRQSESSLRLTACVPLLKGDRFEWELQKLTELGIHAIQPMITERTIVRELSSSKAKRYEAIIKEASEQSGRQSVPKLLGLKSFAYVLQDLGGKEAVLLHTESKHPYLVKPKAQEFAFLTGPEGGFSDIEVQLANEAKIGLASFGERVLRAETAAIAVATHLLY
jgi:16S rRNA (uracil1498-N3)-methyltransferase